MYKTWQEAYMYFFSVQLCMHTFQFDKTSAVHTEDKLCFHDKCK